MPIIGEITTQCFKIPTTMKLWWKIQISDNCMPAIVGKCNVQSQGLNDRPSFLASPSGPPQHQWVVHSAVQPRLVSESYNPMRRPFPFCLVLKHDPSCVVSHPEEWGVDVYERGGHCSPISACPRNQPHFVVPFCQFTTSIVTPRFTMSIVTLSVLLLSLPMRHSVHDWSRHCDAWLPWAVSMFDRCKEERLLSWPGIKFRLHNKSAWAKIRQHLKHFKAFLSLQAYQSLANISDISTPCQTPQSLANT